MKVRNRPRPRSGLFNQASYSACMMSNYFAVFSHDLSFQADPPKHDSIPVKDAVGVTVVIITCTYHEQEFVRVGYYVNNEYSDPEFKENPPEVPDFTKVLIICVMLIAFS